MVIRYFAPAALAVLAACSATAPQAAEHEIVTPEVLSRHDYALAHSANERTALAYLYTAWNDGQLEQARKTYWVSDARFADPKPPPGAANMPSPRYTIRKVVGSGNQVAVLALVEGFGIDRPPPSGPRCMLV